MEPVDLIEYDWDPETGWALFVYERADGTTFTEERTQHRWWTDPKRALLAN